MFIHAYFEMGEQHSCYKPAAAPSITFCILRCPPAELPLNYRTEKENGYISKMNNFWILITNLFCAIYLRILF